MARHRLQSRRQLLRAASGAALAMLGSGARLLIAASPAGAQENLDRGCCVTIFHPSQWCPFMCQEAGLSLRCWTCNFGSCKCCECTEYDATLTDCFAGQPFVCSYITGCC